MQKVVLTIDNTKNAYIFLRLIKQFDFVRSIEFEQPEITDETEDEIFTDDLADDFYLDEFQMTVKELRLQTLQDEQEKGMSKEEFFKSMKEWRETIEK
jgi:hypothetical protein